MTWIIYIVRCQDGTLYTGITKDLTRRLLEHNESHRGAKYTRTRRPVKLVFAEGVDNRSSAAKREYQIKQLSRAQKENLINEFKGRTS